jgi:predicted transposase/invertase (TIGR01784 family)
MREEISVIAQSISKQKPKRKPPRRDDELWKGILADVFEDFLRFFFPDADNLFDFKKKFVFLDKEFNRLFPPEENTAGVRFVDKLVKVHLKAGGSKFILTHVEIQGSKGHEELGSRMFRYFYRAKDKHNVSITAFAILIDDVKSYHPKIYKEEYLGTRVSYEFNTYKLLDQDEERLRANPNPFAVVALTVLMALKNKKIDDEGLKDIKVDLARELIKRKLDKVKHEKIMAFLAYYVNFENPGMMIKFEEEVIKLTGRTTPMGVKEILLERRERVGMEKGFEKGIEEGRQLERAKALEEKKEEKKAVARNCKNEGVDLNAIVKITGLSLEEIKSL